MSTSSTFTVHALDVWGNADDGYQVNDVYPSMGRLELDDNADSAAILAALIAAGYVDADCTEIGEVIGDEDLYIDDQYGKPALELRKVRV